jgi:microcystin-dependent protein
MTNLFAQEPWARRGERPTTSSIGMSELPVGVPVPWPAAAAPPGWLICDGSAVPAGCPTLTLLYGANLPDLKGLIIVGLDAAQVEFDTLGETAGAKTHALTVAEMPVHAHDLNGRPDDPTSTGSWFNDVEQTTQGIQQTSTVSAGGGTAHNNLQPYKVFNYIVKAA